MYEAKLEFQEGLGGVMGQIPFMGGMGVFWNYTFTLMYTDDLGPTIRNNPGPQCLRTKVKFSFAIENSRTSAAVQLSILTFCYLQGA